MRCKKNIILTLEILISFYRNIISHLTEKVKIITLSLVIIMLSFTNIALCSSNIFNNSNVSALDYSSNVGIGFTFNPTLSVNISPNDLIIPNLAPGTTSDSNIINVSVATNASHGYTLSATVGDSLHNNTNLTHANNTDIFSSIAMDANLANLTTDNTWGYSYKNNIATTPTWSSYSGLSNSASKVLFNTDSNANSSIDFKIAAKASEAQASGAYTGIINFTATTKPMPKTIDDIAYMQTFAELDTVDLASVKSSMTLNSAYILKDIRDEKEYCVTRLEDGNVWMTQNLDLDLVQNKTYIHADTDLGWSPNDFNVNASWTPTSDLSWAQNKTAPYYVDPGDKYVYTSNSDADDIIYNSLSDCINAGHTDCQHYHIGNYYNWNAARADGNDNTSICPAGWRLPNLDSNEYGNLLVSYNIIRNNTSTTYLTDGFNNIRKAPLYFIRSGTQGDIPSTGVAPGVQGVYFYNKTTAYASYMIFNKTTINPIWNNQYAAIRRYGESIRCLAR